MSKDSAKAQNVKQINDESLSAVDSQIRLVACPSEAQMGLRPCANTLHMTMSLPACIDSALKEYEAKSLYSKDITTALAELVHVLAKMPANSDDELAVMFTDKSNEFWVETYVEGWRKTQGRRGIRWQSTRDQKTYTLRQVLERLYHVQHQITKIQLGVDDLWSVVETK